MKHRVQDGAGASWELRTVTLVTRDAPNTESKNPTCLEEQEGFSFY